MDSICECSICRRVSSAAVPDERRDGYDAVSFLDTQTGKRDVSPFNHWFLTTSHQPCVHKGFYCYQQAVDDGLLELDCYGQFMTEYLIMLYLCVCSQRLIVVEGIAFKHDARNLQSGG